MNQEKKAVSVFFNTVLEKARTDEDVDLIVDHLEQASRGIDAKAFFLPPIEVLDERLGMIPFAIRLGEPRGTPTTIEVFPLKKSTLVGIRAFNPKRSDIKLESVSASSALMTTWSRDWSNLYLPINDVERQRRSQGVFARRYHPLYRTHEISSRDPLTLVFSAVPFEEATPTAFGAVIIKESVPAEVGVPVEDQETWDRILKSLQLPSE